MNQVATLNGKSPRRQTEIPPMDDQHQKEFESSMVHWHGLKFENKSLKEENERLTLEKRGAETECEGLRSRIATADSHVATANIECERARVELETRATRISELEVRVAGLEAEKKLIVRTLRAGLDVLEEDQQIAVTGDDEHQHG
jgi:chromosome segregation ATPase